MTALPSDREAFAAFLLRCRTRRLDDKPLFAAMEATPRGAFIPTQHQTLAWSERMLPIECGEAIEGVDQQASILSALALDPSHRVLEVGTGSGFTAAVMARLAARVLTVERYRTLAVNARQRMEAFGLANVSVRHMDGTNGIMSEGPYDRIVVWAAFEGLPRVFVDQLATGGILVAPIGPAEGVQQIARLTKVGSRFDREDIGTARLQPLTAGIAAAI